MSVLDTSPWEQEKMGALESFLVPFRKESLKRKSHIQQTSALQPDNSLRTNRAASLYSLDDEVAIWTTALDYAVDTMKRRIRNLGQERNRFTTFGRLPSEVLLNIAEWVAIPMELYLKVGRITALHRLSWVCQSWRRTLFDHPNLWTTISISEAPLLLEHAIALSRSQPLIIRDTQSRRRRGTSYRLWNLILTQRDRWKDVDILLERGNHLPNDSAQSPALQLETLRFSSSKDSEVCDKFTFPMHFIGATLPHLRHLKLHGVQLGTNSPQIHNLQTLHMKECSLSGEDLWSLIHSSPNLLDLELIDNHCPHLDQRATLATEFPSLRRLKITAASSLCTLILLQLTLLNCEDLVISAYSFDWQGGPSSHWGKFAETMASTINNSYKLSEDLQDVTLTVKNDEGVFVSMSASRWTVTTSNISDELAVTLDIARDLYQLLQLPPNPSIHATFDDHLDSIGLQPISILYQITQIKTLKLTISKPGALIHYMARPDVDGNWLFPQMTRLELWNLDPLTGVRALEHVIRARRQSFLAPLEYLCLGGDPGRVLSEEEQRLAEMMKPGMLYTGDE